MSDVRAGTAIPVPGSLALISPQSGEWSDARTRRAMLIGFGAIGVVMAVFTLVGNVLGAAHTSSDEAAYLQYAHNLLQGGYAVAGQQREGLYLWHAPALPLLIAPLVALGLPIEVIRLIGPLCLIAAGVVLTAILRRVTRAPVALAAGLALCLYPPYWRLLPELFVEPLALLCCLLGFAALQRAYERRRLRWAALAGLGFGFMILGREEFGYLAMAAVVAAGLALVRPRWRAAARPLALSSVVALVVCAPWLAYTYAKTHVLFYWSAASGESLYWMSSTAPGESGSWQRAQDVFSDPHLAVHRALFARVDAMSQLRANRTLTRLALSNLEHHPGTYLRHVLDNGERIFLGVPFSFQTGTLSNLAFYGVADVALLLLAVTALAILRRHGRRLPAPLVPLVAFGVIGLAYHLPAAAYPRMATLSIPAFVVVAALGAEAWLATRPTPAAAAVSPVGDVLDLPGAGRRVIRGSAWRTAAYVGASVANAAVLPFLFRYLGVVRAGEYVTVVSLSTILAGIVETGLTGVSLRLFSLASAAERPELIRELLSMRMAVLTAATALLGAFVVIAGYPAIIVAGFGVCAAGVVAENVGSAYNTELAATLRLGWIAISNVVRQVVIAALMLTLIVLRAPLIWFFVTVVPAGLAQAVVSALATRRRIPLGLSVRVSAWWPLARASALYVVAMALGFVYFRIPLVMMSLLDPGRDTGLFGAAFRLVETLTLMTGFVLTAPLPLLTRAAGRDRERLIYAVGRLVEVSLIAGAAVTVALGTGAGLTIHVLAGPRFDGSVGVLRALSVILLVRFVTTAWGFGLLSLGSYRAVLAANAAATAAAIAAGAVAIPLMGVYGGVVAVLAAELGLAAAYGLMISRRLPGAGFPARTGSVVIAATALAAGVLALPLSDLARPCVAVAVFAAVLAAFRVYPPELLAQLPGRRRRRADP